MIKILIKYMVNCDFFYFIFFAFDIKNTYVEIIVTNIISMYI